jgi:uncharacterized protein (TIGR03000 family)
MFRTVLLLLSVLCASNSLLAQPPRPADARPIVFEIRVPAEASVEIEGVKTRASGETRQFKTPDVPQGRRYSYTIKVTYDGVTSSHQLVLTHAGPNVLDLRNALLAARPAAKSDGTFTLYAPPNITLRPGDAAPLSVRIRRESIADAVEVSFKGLPPGVKINDATIAVGKSEQSALAVSTKDAQPGVSTVEVLAKAGKVQKSVSFRLTVSTTPPPPLPGDTKQPDEKPKPPPADLPNDPPPAPPDPKKPDPPKPGDAKKPEEKPKPPPADLPNDPPPKPAGNEKKPI